MNMSTHSFLLIRFEKKERSPFLILQFEKDPFFPDMSRGARAYETPMNASNFFIGSFHAFPKLVKLLLPHISIYFQ